MRDIRLGARRDPAPRQRRRPQVGLGLLYDLNLGSRVVQVHIESNEEEKKVQGLRWRVEDGGFRVQDSGFRVQGSEFRVEGRGLRAAVKPVSAWRASRPCSSRTTPTPGWFGVDFIFRLILSQV